MNILCFVLLISKIYSTNLTISENRANQDEFTNFDNIPKEFESIFTFANRYEKLFTNKIEDLELYVFTYKISRNCSFSWSKYRMENFFKFFKIDLKSRFLHCAMKKSSNFNYNAKSKEFFEIYKSLKNKNLKNKSYDYSKQCKITYKKNIKNLTLNQNSGDINFTVIDNSSKKNINTEVINKIINVLLEKHVTSNFIVICQKNNKFEPKTKDSIKNLAKLKSPKSKNFCFDESFMVKFEERNGLDYSIKINFRCELIFDTANYIKSHFRNSNKDKLIDFIRNVEEFEINLKFIDKIIQPENAEPIDNYFISGSISSMDSNIETFYVSIMIKNSICVDYKFSIRIFCRYSNPPNKDFKKYFFFLKYNSDRKYLFVYTKNYGDDNILIYDENRKLVDLLFSNIKLYVEHGFSNFFSLNSPNFRLLNDLTNLSLFYKKSYHKLSLNLVNKFDQKLIKILLNYLSKEYIIRYLYFKENSLKSISKFYLGYFSGASKLKIESEGKFINNLKFFRSKNSFLGQIKKTKPVGLIDQAIKNKRRNVRNMNFIKQKEVAKIFIKNSLQTMKNCKPFELLKYIVSAFFENLTRNQSYFNIFKMNVFSLHKKDYNENEYFLFISVYKYIYSNQKEILMHIQNVNDHAPKVKKEKIKVFSILRNYTSEGLSFKECISKRFLTSEACLFVNYKLKWKYFLFCLSDNSLAKIIIKSYLYQFLIFHKENYLKSPYPFCIENSINPNLKCLFKDEYFNDLKIPNYENINYFSIDYYFECLKDREENILNYSDELNSFDFLTETGK